MTRPRPAGSPDELGGALNDYLVPQEYVCLWSLR